MRRGADGGRCLGGGEGGGVVAVMADEEGVVVGNEGGMRWIVKRGESPRAQVLELVCSCILSIVTSSSSFFPCPFLKHNPAIGSTFHTYITLRLNNISFPSAKGGTFLISTPVPASQPAHGRHTVLAGKPSTKQTKTEIGG